MNPDDFKERVRVHFDQYHFNTPLWSSISTHAEFERSRIVKKYKRTLFELPIPSDQLPDWAKLDRELYRQGYPVHNID